ncbi:hypothetical protein F5Y01DRAFT_310997 [Xylaria sp. FL0043]|nr:hypothetical protein F5Y01DRAFT_310997 [Xylaria sp. FL0043]
MDYTPREYEPHGYYGRDSRTASRRHRAGKNPASQNQGFKTDNHYPLIPGDYSDEEYEAPVRPMTPSRRHSGSLSPFVPSPARRPSPNCYAYHPEQYRSEHTVSQPMPIPNAIPKQRLPVIDRDGFIYKLGSKAPHTVEQIKQLKEIDEVDNDLAENYRRQKQGIYKWAAEEKERERRAAKKKAAGITDHNGESSTRQQNMRAARQSDVVPTAKNIQIGFHPEAYRGRHRQRDEHSAGPSGGSGSHSGPGQFPRGN